VTPDPAMASAWGIADGYHDISGRWVPADPEAVGRVLAAMGALGESPPASPVRFARPGQPVPTEEPADLVTEDGAVVPLKGALPPDLPFGYHALRRRRDGASTRLIVSPGRCHLPEDLWTWGWAVQLYALRSRESWGIGDLADLRRLARWSRRELGAGVLLLSPLHAPMPGLPQEPSPYFPSSRRFRNPLHLRLEDIPGAERLGHALRRMSAAGWALNAERLIDRDRVHRLKTQALELLFAGFADDGEFEGYRRREGQPLRDYATFCALTERHGAPWREWPAELRRPRAAAGRDLGDDRRVRFHQWVQWLLDRQLARAGAEIGLIHDLAIGARADGADAWMWQDTIADGVRVGAPPDPFNAAGQDWGMPPFDPWRLRAAGYEPFIQLLRAAFRHGAGLRLDHVMGLFRLFWIPAGCSPAQGVYVRYPHRDLLDILALESQRAGAFVVGEDLGTVEPSMRTELASRSVLSYRLLWFEDGPPSAYPRESVAALGTHDLPTLAGVWEGSDSDPAIRDRLGRVAQLPEGASVEQATEAAYRALAASPSRVLAATLEDALGVPERPNKPGTRTCRKLPGTADDAPPRDEWPNWSLALPAGLERLMTEAGPVRVARALGR
jgi:4-alpha-glucanotransferase